MQKKQYEKPAIIHKDILRTRAGSPLGDPSTKKSDPFDPANLFGGK